MEADDADVFLAGTLLGLDEASGAVDADDQAAGDFGIESAAVAGLVDAEDALDPGDDFVGRRVGRLVEVDDTRGDVGLEITAMGVAANRDGREVGCTNEDWEELMGGGWGLAEGNYTFVVILEE